MEVRTLKSEFEDLAAKHPTKTAIKTTNGETVSFTELIALINETEKFLQSSGITKVGLILSQGPEMALCCLSVMSVATAVPLNPNYTASELAVYLKESEVEAVFVDRATLDLVSLALETFPLPLFEIVPIADSRRRFSLDFSSEVNIQPQLKPKQGRESTDTALLLLTSGSTSKPKLVPLTEQNLIASAGNIANSLSLDESDCCLNMLPLFHVGAIVDLLLGPLLVGGSSVVCDEISSDHFFESVSSFPVTWFQAVPTLLKHIHDDLSSAPKNLENSELRFVRSVSSPLPPSLLKDLEAVLNVPIIEIYGMTETSGLIASNPLPPKEKRIGSVGIPFGPEVRIIDALGNSLPDGEKGEIAVRGETVMSGYKNSDSTTDSSFIDNWLKTGDEGFLSEDGFLTITGRVKEIINRGGEKISPREIDEIALLYDNVIEAASFPISHSSLGEEVAIALVLGNSDSFSDTAFQHHCSMFLARFKVPRKVFIEKSLPKGGSGKLQRHMLTVKHDARTEIVQSFREAVTDIEHLIIENARGQLKLDCATLSDDFFELGGDSLTAVSFVAELENKLAMTIGVATLYDYPVLAEFADKIQFQENSSETFGAQSPVKISTELSLISRQMMAELIALLAPFKGSRRVPDSLLVGVNTLSDKPPLFWCTNNAGEFNQFSSSLSSMQPIYGMRTLWGIKGRSDAATRELAQIYLNELLHIQPQGPYFIGGFCEGGKVAKELVRLLLQQGRRTSLLLLQESSLTETYDGRLALFYCPDSPFSAYTKFSKPELGWSKLYSGHVSIHRTPWSHYQTQTYENASRFAKLVEEELKLVLSDTSRDDEIRFIKDRDDLQLLNNSDYSAVIAVKGRPIIAVPGKVYDLIVKITNSSTAVWKPSKDSGISLGARWVTLFGHYHGDTDHYIPLEEALSPGDSITLKMRVRAPLERKPWQLDVDLVDEGVRWFFDMDERKYRNRLFVMNREGFLHSLAEKLTMRFYSN